MNIIEETKNKFKRMLESRKNYLFDYVFRVQNQSFDELPFNVIDALILSLMSYYRFDFMKLKENKSLKLYEAAAIYNLDDKLKNISANSMRNPFLEILAVSKRYKDLELFNFERVYSIAHEQQFAAISIKLNKNTVFVSFSGTDSTLTGIKEDMNMSYLSKIPSQIKAKEYINERKIRKFKKIYIGGHSKGGNLAVFAGMNLKANAQNKVQKIFNFDGPGFTKKYMDEQNNPAIFSKVITIVPEMSVFGMIWNNPNDIFVIESNNVSVMQHDPFSWKIDELNHFAYKNCLSKSSLAINNSINEYFEKLDKDQRRKFIDLLWYFTKDTEAKSLSDLKKNIVKNLFNSFMLYKDLDKDSKKVLQEHLKVFFKSYINNTKTLEDPDTSIDQDMVDSFDHFVI